MRTATRRARSRPGSTTEGLLADRRAFVFIAIERQLTGALQQGTFVLRKNMTPDQLVTALLAPPAITYVDIGLRTGLRLEQITAKLETLDGLQMDPQEFYDLVKTPPAELLADYPWLKKILQGRPEGRVPRGLPLAGDATASCRHDARGARAADARQVRRRRRRADERAGGARPDLLPGPHAGLDRRARGGPRRERAADRGRLPEPARPQARGQDRLLNADPTVFYAHDTLELDEARRSTSGRTTRSGRRSGRAHRRSAAGRARRLQHLHHRACRPARSHADLPSIDAALEPDTDDGYLYFLAIPDGTATHAFAKTSSEHQANIKKYGYT